jgi:hypothetical protein
MGCLSSSASSGCNLGGANENAVTTGNAAYKAAGQNRFLELALKYYF